MPIYALGERVPNIHVLAYVHPHAVVIGAVTIGAESTIWPGTVLRADFGRIDGRRQLLCPGRDSASHDGRPAHGDGR